MSIFSEFLSNNKQYDDILRYIIADIGPVGIIGLPLSPKAHIISSLCDDTCRKALVVLPTEAEATQLASDINFICASPDAAVVYTARDYSFDCTQSESREYEHIRLNTLHKIITGNYKIITCSAEASMQFTIPPEELRKRILTIDYDTEIPIKKLTDILINAGYKMTDLVEGPGQFSARGFIVDFFPPSTENPVRIEFWDDTINSISYFDTTTQRHIDTADSCHIYPANEIIFESTTVLSDKIKEYMAQLSGKGSRRAKEILQKDCDLLDSGITLQSVDKYLSLAYSQTATIFDYCKGNLLFIAESSDVKKNAEAVTEAFIQTLKELFTDGILCAGLDKFMLTPTELIMKYEKHNAIYTDNFARGSFDTPVKALSSFNLKQNPNWNGRLEALLEDLRPAIKSGNHCVVFAGTEKYARELAFDLDGEDMRALFCPVPPESLPSDTVAVLPGTLSSGYASVTDRFSIFTYAKSASVGRIKATAKKRKAANAVRSLDELSRGDYVVHESHGIGCYQGIEKKTADGVTKDYIHIKFGKGVSLYVSVTDLNSVSKYVGPRDNYGNVKLSNIGDGSWQKTKSKVRASAKDMAKQLLALYAKRLKLQGHAFSADFDIQKDFENKFEYVETHDQIRCTYEIKQDMEKSVPMDRLLCGDVGFGKTEVALRAAFKCVAEGKQVAILVPTTILALQHYNSIIKRFDGFAVNVEMLSRFRTPKEHKEIVDKLKRGTVDIVVGTHTLIAKKVNFKNLGLIIIDEEQRFGVKQKEYIKEKYPTVDCLTLSATPIPRTMNMALSGIRDMSVIEEAPLDRSPVQTYVMGHRWDVLAEAIKKELRRGGQVYYLHNRVDDLQDIALTIESLVPNAVVGIGHGQMEEKELSEVWKQLLEGQIDVLVCTTIIETGVDVPNANTLIIQNADMMGLSQLHQIRGRVGRSSRRGFAYFTFNPTKSISEDAQKRLDAIRQYTEFGSGFKIAMRDLEIRGAGEILGSAQHGHMEAVGYDMYITLLNEAICEEKGIAPTVQKPVCVIDINMNAYIPEKYITFNQHRISMYKKIADISTQAEADDVLDELIDRFGEPPEGVKGLVNVALARHKAADADITRIRAVNKTIIFYLKENDPHKFAVLNKIFTGRTTYKNNPDEPYVAIERRPKETEIQIIMDALKALEKDRLSGEED